MHWVIGSALHLTPFCVLTAHTEMIPDLALRTNFLSVFGNASEQAGKLGMGKNSRIITMYQDLQVYTVAKKIYEGFFQAD